MREIEKDGLCESCFSVFGMPLRIYVRTRWAGWNEFHGAQAVLYSLEEEIADDEVVFLALRVTAVWWAFLFFINSCLGYSDLRYFKERLFWLVGGSEISWRGTETRSKWKQAGSRRTRGKCLISRCSLRGTSYRVMAACLFVEIFVVN